MSGMYNILFMINGVVIFKCYRDKTFAQTVLTP